MKGMVSKGRLEEVLMPCPPPTMQAEFGKAFDRILGAESTAGGRVELRANELFRPCLDNAFGELAPVRSGGQPGSEARMIQLARAREFQGHCGAPAPRLRAADLLFGPNSAGKSTVLAGADLPS